MPVHPWRFDPGDTAYVRPATSDTAYVRPATSDRKVTLLTEYMHTAPSGIKCPHWIVRDTVGDEFRVSQLELSSRATVVKGDSVKLLQGARK